MDHDELECPNLHEQLEFTVRVYSISKGMLEFETWFNTVFKVTNPTLATSFSFERSTSEGQEVIEVTQFDQLFNINALESVFEASRFEQTNATKPTVAVDAQVLNFNPKLN